MRLDQVFISEHSVNMVNTCNTLVEHRGINTDHLPILTELDLETDIHDPDPFPNFREVDWEGFRNALVNQLDPSWVNAPIITQGELDCSCLTLTTAIQKAINEQVPDVEILSKSKHWWTKELMQLCRQSEKLGRKSYKLRHEPEHKVHNMHKNAKKRYDNTLQHTKKQHW